MKKSGRKRVYDQNDEGVQGKLNQAGREIFRGKPREITPGPDGLRDPILSEQSNTFARQVVERRHRRRLISPAAGRLKKRVYRHHRKAELGHS
ncbi:MAG TPA: hypothetical protein VFB72_13435 [Verrucomicrobiae bacterium]|nr:hypothetical protein [Verrucomicrobiae bacterium]